MSITKFSEDGNRFGIKNDRGETVTNEYLRRYIQCWCRKEHGYSLNRKANFDYFMSDAWLETQRGKTASQVGKAASIHERWGKLSKQTAGSPQAAAPAPSTPAVTMVEYGSIRYNPATHYIDDNGELRSNPVTHKPAAPAPAAPAPKPAAKPKADRQAKLDAAKEVAKKQRDANIAAMRKSMEDAAAAGDERAKKILASMADPVVAAQVDAMVTDDVVNEKQDAGESARPEIQAVSEVVES